MNKKLDYKVGMATLYALKDLYKDYILTMHELGVQPKTDILSNASKLEKYLKEIEEQGE